MRSFSRRRFLIAGAMAAVGASFSKNIFAATGPAELYLGRWEWHTDAAGDSYWRAPGGDQIGTLDLRSLPQMGVAGSTPEGFGLFVYDAPKVHANLIHDFGNDLTRNLTAVEKSAIRTLFGLPLGTTVVDRLGEALRQWLLDPDYYDATGQARWKPLRGSLGRPVEFVLGGFGRISREAFDKNHPAFNASIAVFKNDYLRNREVHQLPLSLLRKWTGMTLLRLTGKISDLDAQSLLPSKYASDGAEPPTTAISDNFNRANESLDAGPWTEVIGDWTVTSNEAKIAADAAALARHTTALSTDDHKSKVTITAIQASPVGVPGPIARFSTDASPNQDYYGVVCDGALVIFRKVVNGTQTTLDTNKSVTVSLPDDLEIECNDSAQKSRFNGTIAHDFTDTSLSGQLNCGMIMRRTGDGLDDFSAEDLSAVACSGGLMLMGVGC